LAKWLKQIKNGLDHLKSTCKTNSFNRVNASSIMAITMTESHKKKLRSNLTKVNAIKIVPKINFFMKN